MINSRKKGFTLVELVIVIAVVAILAAVLIPTFSSLVKKANVAQDTAVAKNMNTALAEYSALNGKPEDFEEVLTAIEEAGYVLANLNAKAGGNLYGWDEKNNQIVYLDQEGNVIYQNVDFVKAEVKFVVTNTDAAPGWVDGTIVDMSKPEGPKALKGALEAGISITLTKDITDLTDVITIKNDVVVNLNDYDFDASNQGSRPFELADGATLTINAEGSTINCGLYGLINIQSGATANVIINGGTYEAETDNGAFIKVRPGSGDVDITLNDVEYTDAANDGFIINSQGFSGVLNLTVNGGEYKANVGFHVPGNVNIKDATISTNATTIEAWGDETTVNISNCTINAEDAKVKGTPAYGVFASNNAKVIVKDCTITTVNGDLCVAPTGGEIEATYSEGSYTYVIYEQKSNENLHKITINSDVYTEPNENN